MAGPGGSRGRWGLGQCVFTVDSVVVAMLTCGLLGVPKSRRQYAAQGGISSGNDRQSWGCGTVLLLKQRCGCSLALPARRRRSQQTADQSSSWLRSQAENYAALAGTAALPVHRESNLRTASGKPLDMKYQNRFSIWNPESEIWNQKPSRSPRPSTDHWYESKFCPGYIARSFSRY